MDAAELWLFAQPFRQFSCRSADLLHPQTQSSQSALSEPRFERVRILAKQAGRLSCRRHEFARSCGDSQDDVAMAVQILGGTVNDSRRAHCDRLNQFRCRECAVNDERHCSQNSGQSVNVDDFQKGVRNGFDQTQLRVAPEGARHRCQVACVHQCDVQSELLVQPFEQLQGLSVERARHDHMILRTCERHHDGRQGPHP